MDRRRHAVRRCVVVTVAALVAYYVVPLRALSAEWGDGLRVGVALLGVVVLATLLGRQLHRHLTAAGHGSPGRQVELESLFYLLVLAVVGFSVAYYGLAGVDGQFFDLRTRTDALYFTLATMTSVGYGDVHASGQEARVLVSSQLAFDIVFVGAALAVFTARLGRRAGGAR